jgi:hypothetical protein
VFVLLLVLGRGVVAVGAAVEEMFAVGEDVCEGWGAVEFGGKVDVTERFM